MSGVSAEKVEEPVQKQAASLVHVEINSQNAAFNVLVGFIGVAQRRGTFAIDESAKIYECLERFKGPEPQAASAT